MDVQNLKLLELLLESFKRVQWLLEDKIKFFYLHHQHSISLFVLPNVFTKVNANYTTLSIVM